MADFPTQTWTYLFVEIVGICHWQEKKEEREERAEGKGTDLEEEKKRAGAPYSLAFFSSHPKLQKRE